MWQRDAVSEFSQVLTNTWLCSRAMRFQSRPTNWPSLTIESPVAQWLEHPTRSRRVVGSSPIWGSDFSIKKIVSQWCTCVLELHLACIFDLTTGRKVCPRSWPPTSTKIPRVKSSLVSTPVSVNNRHPISSMDTLSNKINQQISCCRTTIKEFGRRMKRRLLEKSNREKENSQDGL